MSLISFSPLADGVTAVNAAATNTPLSTIYNDYNGNITNANISPSAAIAGSKINLASIANPYKFSVYRNSAQNTGNSAFAIVNFDTKNFDTGSNLDIVTNVGRFTAPVAGFYHFDATVNIVGNSIDLLGALYKNGAAFTYGTRTDASTTGGVNEGVSVSSTLQLSANDYVEIYTFCGSTHALDVGTAPQKTHFSGFLLSAT